jgi:hypothetical protein
MNAIYKLLFVILSIGLIASCKPKNIEISNIETMIAKAEINIDTLNETDWSTLNLKIQTLEEKMEKNPNLFSKEETAKIEGIKYRYVDILKTKEARDFNQNLDEWSRIIREAAKDLKDSLNL